MLMRISWGRVRPGQWHAYEEAYARVADMAVEGLLGRWLVRDTNDPDSYFILTCWTSQDAITRWEASEDYQRTYRPSIMPFVLGSYSTSVCEVKHASAAGLIPRMGATS